MPVRWRWPRWWVGKVERGVQGTCRDWAMDPSGGGGGSRDAPLRASDWPYLQDGIGMEPRRGASRGARRFWFLDGSRGLGLHADGGWVWPGRGRCHVLWVPKEETSRRTASLPACCRWRSRLPACPVDVGGRLVFETRPMLPSLPACNSAHPRTALIAALSPMSMGSRPATGAGGR